MMDGLYPDGIPQAGDVALVQASLDAARPVTADLTVVAPIAEPLDFEILLRDAAGQPEADPTIRQAVEDELRDLIQREADPGKTMLISKIREAISVASGEYDHVLIDPVADVPHTTGEIATFGEITWAS
jgi:uncharacterized phage protein gp47/JayE